MCTILVQHKSFRCTTCVPLVCVANKGLTQSLSSLDATLTKKPGEVSGSIRSHLECGGLPPLFQHGRSHRVRTYAESGFLRSDSIQRENILQRHNALQAMDVGA